MSLEAGRNYVLVNRYIKEGNQNGTAMDLSGGDHRSIIGFGRHGGDNQQWKAENHGGKWVFVNVATANQGSPKYLSIEGGLEGAGNGTKVVAGDQPQTWEVQPDPNDHSYHRISVHHEVQDNEGHRKQKRFDIDLSDHGKGIDVTLWAKADASANQAWQFQAV